MAHADYASFSIQYRPPLPHTKARMSNQFSSTYAELVADLTRDVQRAQPRDVLQYCANWFNSRLQEQRTRIRDAFQAQAFGRPSAAAGLTDELFVDRSIPPRGSMPNGLGSVASSVRSSPMPSHSQPPQPQPQPQPPVTHPQQPNPFALSSGSAFSLVPGARLADPFASTASPRPRPSYRALTPQRHNVIHEEEEPPTPNSPAAPAPSGSPAFLAPPPSALGRRVSVSAESITPSASGSLPPMPNFPKSVEQMQRIRASIANAFLFRNLDPEQERAVLGAMQERSVQSGERVIEQGADGDYFYVVESGALDCFVKRPGENEGVGDEVHPTFGRKVLTYTTGGTFGELALMYNAPRAATIVATEPSTLWALDRMSFRSIILSVANRKRKMYERFLATVPLLETLDASERSRIADVLEPRSYNEGESVVEEGDPGNEFFIIESGEATAFKRVKGEDGELRDDVVMKYGPGDFFGELALLHRAPRAATVRASVRAGDSDEPPVKLKVAVLDAQAFTRLLGNLKSLLDRHATQNYGASYRHN
ncbi:CAMP-dependent protein kinase inhibitor [Ceratobasidium theobromae]|uniref:cAMP-dependent protein kinase regulatory subunit n=1 Tax=Ceratobasidium theobromae TaxID=1582974 RepID=A0A5N5QBT3_9AGAM|nr:CAMP-dependent protein kinase inhibitor [Ceratobasidium theobromae]